MPLIIQKPFHAAANEQRLASAGWRSELYPLSIIFAIITAQPVAFSCPDPGSVAVVEKIILAQGIDPQAESTMFKDLPFTDPVYSLIERLPQFKWLHLNLPYGGGRPRLTVYEFAVALKRTVDSLIYENPVKASTGGVTPGYHGPADDINTIRILCKRFEFELKQLGCDTSLFQKRLRDIAESALRGWVTDILAGNELKGSSSELTGLEGKPVWIYAELNRFSHKGVIDPIPPGRVLSDGELANVVATLWKQLAQAENSESIRKNPADRPENYDLKDVATMQRMARVTRAGLQRIGIDVKGIERIATAAEERRIRAAIDIVRDQTVK